MRKLRESKSDKINERERERTRDGKRGRQRERERERERERKGDGRTPLQQLGKSMVSSTVGRHSSRLDG